MIINVIENYMIDKKFRRMDKNSIYEIYMYNFLLKLKILYKTLCIL